MDCALSIIRMSVAGGLVLVETLNIYKCFLVVDRGSCSDTSRPKIRLRDGSCRLAIAASGFVMHKGQAFPIKTKTSDTAKTDSCSLSNKDRATRKESMTLKEDWKQCILDFMSIIRKILRRCMARSIVRRI